MNHRRPWWIVFSLLPPLFALFALLMPFGCGGGSPAATATPTPGNVAVAFVVQGPSGNFAQINLNIAGIRLNPAPNAMPSQAGWVNISPPANPSTGIGPNSDVQIDLLHTRSTATFFNIGSVPAATYQSVQVQVDDNNPGTVVPACGSAGPGNEGCTSYPIKFANPQPALIFTLGTPMTINPNTTVPLVISLPLGNFTLPASTGEPFVIMDPLVPTQVDASSVLALVTGTIKNRGLATGTSGVSVKPQTIFAELSGTNTIIATAPVEPKGLYSLELPAAPEGTTYDIYVAGGGSTYDARQGITVVPGQVITDEDMKASKSNSGTFTGVIADVCTGLGIPGAQLVLLAPPPTPIPPATPTSTPTSSSFCFEHPNQCVVVASANADVAGNYPLPGTIRVPSGFDEIPAGQRDLALMITASGYNPLSSAALARQGKVAICSASTSTTQCSFSLDTGYITGRVNLTAAPPPGSEFSVQVFAENTGTNELVSMLSPPLDFKPNGISSLPFTLNVPIGPPGTGYDLFALATDPYVGSPDPFPGHDIPVLANLPAPQGICCQAGVAGGAEGCLGLPNPTPTPVASADFAPMNCVGHGSITGTVQNPDLGTSVEVEKLAGGSPVQILGTAPALFSSLAPPRGNDAYTLCVPADSYLLQRFELSSATPAATPSPTPAAVGTAQVIMVPLPASTSSPCPSSCSNGASAGSPCPGICSATTASPL